LNNHTNAEWDTISSHNFVSDLTNCFFIFYMLMAT
jgi:hypothetical protein